MEAPTIDDLDRVTADVTLVRKRLAKLDPAKLDVKTELTDNLLPLFEGLAEAIKKRVHDLEEEVAELGEMVDELADQSSDVLHPDTAGRIVEVFALGELLAAELDQFVPKLDDLTKKRVRQIVKSYRQGAVVVTQMIAEITIPLEPEAQPGPDGVDAGDTAAPPGEAGGELDEGEDEEEEDDDDLDDLADEEG